MENNKEEIDEELEAQLRKELEEDKKFLDEIDKETKRLEENRRQWEEIRRKKEEERKDDIVYQHYLKNRERTRNVIAHLDEEKRERDEMLSKMTKEEFDAWYDKINQNAEDFAKENNIKAVEVDIDDKGNVVLNKKDNK